MHKGKYMYMRPFPTCFDSISCVYEVTKNKYTPTLSHFLTEEGNNQPGKET